MGADAWHRQAVDAGHIGLYPASEFRLTDGECGNCPTIPQALWYFRGDKILVPEGKPMDFARKVRAQDDIRAWIAANPQGDPAARPPLIWIGSPSVVENVRMDASGKELMLADGKRVPFSIVPKIDTNLSYYDASSARHFADRPLRLRGSVVGDRFAARVIWPEDYALGARNLQVAPLKQSESIETLVRADGRNPQSTFAARVLWQRDPETAPGNIAGKPVLAFILNGAQGDDDEAHGGHFAIATGRFGANGQWGDWAVNNFYNLGSVSEKGIIASTLPMDAYMADLNSGQSWYRPSYMLVAVLKQDRVPALYQQAIGRVYNHFYRHDFNYRHATANCSGISVETLRSLGWHIPAEGADGRLKAFVALPFMAAKDMSLESGKSAFDYLSTERTNLYPFVAFNRIGEDILQRITSANAARGALETRLAEDIEALLYVHIPQFPSSRAFGQNPVASLDEYMQRAPEDRAQWKIVPAGARDFPEHLLDADIPGDPAQPSDWALAGYGAVIAIIAFLGYRRHAFRRGAHLNRKTS